MYKYLYYDNEQINEVECAKNKAKRNFLNYMRHVNDNVGRPVLAVNSDGIIE